MLNIYIGWDSTEAVAYDVCKYSIERRATIPISITSLKHKPLRLKDLFCRPWMVDAKTGQMRDLIDGMPFSTEFSHTRFLVPALNQFKGWALFMDSDMLCQSNVKELLNKVDDRYALMVVKHRHKVPEGVMKMDGRVQQNYHRKNWSSFVMWNCAHPLNKILSPHYVSTANGASMHAFDWVPENLIGHLGFEYNWIEGSSPIEADTPKVIHYTNGGPWFDNDACRNVMYADLWQKEYEHYMRNISDVISHVPSTKWE